MQEFSWEQTEGCFKFCQEETTLEHGVLTIVLKCLGAELAKSLREESTAKNNSSLRG